MWNTRDFVRGTGFIRLKREFQLGVNGRYEISGGLKRNALSTAIRITRIGLADIPVVLPFLKKRKKKRSPFQTRHLLLALPLPTLSYHRAVSKGSTRFPRLPLPCKARLRTHPSRRIVSQNGRRAELILEFSIDAEIFYFLFAPFKIVQI